MLWIKCYNLHSSIRRYHYTWLSKVITFTWWSTIISALSYSVINTIWKHALQWQKQTRLHLAFEVNNMDVVELLLQSGAEVNVKDLVNRIHRYAIIYNATLQIIRAFAYNIMTLKF